MRGTSTVLLSTLALGFLLLVGPASAHQAIRTGIESHNPRYSHYTGPHHLYDRDQWRARYHHHPIYTGPHHAYDRGEWRRRYHHRAITAWPAPR